MSPRLAFLPAWLVCCWIGISDSSSAQLWTIETIDGRIIQTPAIAIDAAGRAELQNVPEPMEITEWLSVDSGREVQSRSAGQLEIVLIGNGSLAARGVRLEGEQLVIQGAELLEQIPIEIVRALVWRSHERVDRALSQTQGDQDRLIVDAEDAPVVVPGIVQSVSEQAVLIQYQGRVVEFPMEKVLALVWAEITRSELPGTERAMVTTIQGNRFFGKLARWQGDFVEISLSPRSSVVVPSRHIARIAFQSDRMVYLSDVTPIDVEQRTWFAPARDWRRDKSVTGGPISLRDPQTGQIQVFEKGLGVQAYTRLVFENQGGFQRFLAIVGMDAATEGRGDCEVAVVGDGVRLWQSTVKGTDVPQRLDIDIRGIRTLELVVEPGRQFDLSDHLNWSRARLLK